MLVKKLITRGGTCLNWLCVLWRWCACVMVFISLFVPQTTLTPPTHIYTDIVSVFQDKGLVGGCVCVYAITWPRLIYVCVNKNKESWDVMGWDTWKHDRKAMTKPKGRFRLQRAACQGMLNTDKKKREKQFSDLSEEQAWDSGVQFVGRAHVLL